MKKHNESKSNKILVHKNGNVIRRAISFVIVFVMLFCISIYASEELYKQNITVKTDKGNTVTVEAYCMYNDHLIISAKEYEKGIAIRDVLPIESKIQEGIIVNGDMVIGIEVDVGYMTHEEYYETLIIEKGVFYDSRYQDLINATEGDIDETEIVYVKSINNEIIQNNITLQEAKQIATRIFSILENMENNTDYTEYVTIEQPTPVYDNFFDKAKAMFDLIWGMVSDTFEWFISPTVLPYFALGIIVSLITIGILISRKFFWGR